MRFLIFVFNAYSIIFVTSLVKEPEKLFSTYDFLNRYCTLKRFVAFIEAQYVYITSVH